MTLSELSKLTGFSKTTISRVLSGKAEKYRISAETQELIRTICSLATEGDESGQGNAQRLHNDKDKNLGLLVPSISNPFFAYITAAIISEAERFGFSITVFVTQENPVVEMKTLRNILLRNLRGLIVVPVSNRPTELELMQKHMPVILVDRYFQKSPLPFIACNNRKGGYMAMRQLILAGHKNILCIEGPQESITTKEREKGAKTAVKELGEGCNVTYRGNDFSVQNGYLQTKLCQMIHPRPTAIFAMSNTILLGCMKALNEMGLSIPDDMSIISFDDLFYLDYLNPPITRIAQPLTSFGKTAVKVIVESIEHGRPIKSQLLMTPKLIERESVKNLNEKTDSKDGK